MTNSDFPYLHGFSDEEQKRLYSQARFTEQKLYRDIDFSSAKKIIEVGCGVGAQTEILLRRFPELQIFGIDRSEKQLETANKYLSSYTQFQKRYELSVMDATRLDCEAKSFDGAFLCWVLEHVPDPSQVLSEVRRVLKPGAQVVITEVMNASYFLDPYSPNMWRYWMAYNDCQLDQSGDPFVGAKLGNFLLQLGFKDIQTSVKTWHLDSRHPAKRKEMISFWRELLLSASEQLIADKYVTEEIVDGMKKEFDAVIYDKNAVFFDTFIQATARI